MLHSSRLGGVIFASIGDNNRFAGIQTEEGQCRFGCASKGLIRRLRSYFPSVLIRLRGLRCISHKAKDNYYFGGAAEPVHGVGVAASVALSS